VALATAVAYLPSIRAGWVFDDHQLVKPSPALDGLAGLRRAVSTDLYRQAAPRLEASPYWRPLALASFWLDARLGEPPRAMHVGNLVLHALAAALLALVLLGRLERLGGVAGPLAASAATAWWALHPQNVEPVAWISCRYDLLCGLALLGMLALPWRAGLGRAVLHGLLFLAGLLSKDGFGALVLVVPALDWAEERPARAAAPRWVAVGGALAAWWGLRAAVGIQAMDLPGPAALLGLARCYLDAIRIYAVRALLPSPLTISHPYQAGGLAAVGAGGALLLALLVAAILRRRLAVPIAVFLGALIPAAAAMARFGEAPERYLYLPSIGVALLLGDLVAAGLSAPLRWARPLAAVAVAAIAALGLVRLEARLPEWESDGALFTAALRVDPANPQANLNLAIEAGRRGDWGEARRALELAQRGDPRSGRIAGALADVLMRSGDVAGALEQAVRATSVAPWEPEGWFYLAKASHLHGDHAGELAAIEKLLELSPDYPGARRGRALAQCEVSGRTDCRP
jgi:tetratricopeptide (TPR) repeat protein